MNILVLGAGVVGVTTAYALLQDGHEVTVVDRQAEAGSETSFANAGIIATGHALAWGSPQAPLILLRSLLGRDQALRLQAVHDPALWRWGLKFLRQCTAARFRLNSQRKHRLCAYAQAELQAIVAATGVPYDRARRGILYLYRSQRSLDRGAAAIAVLAGAGRKREVIDRDRVCALDPTLAASRDQIAGAIYCPEDESGDACRFTRGLAAWCAGRGARFLWNTTITGIEADGDRVVRVRSTGGDLQADRYVVALGPETPLLTRRFGEPVSIYPVKGLSLTFPAGARPPTMAAIDEDSRIAYAPLGDRLRVTSVAAFAGYDKRHAPDDFAPILAAARRLLPEGGDYGRPSYWCCLRPTTPEGMPMLGRGRHGNLYYNTGHGHLGWTMAAGTARITADLIAGRTPALPLEGLAPR